MEDDIKIEQVLHMNEGEGDYSYANNSLLQKSVILKAQPLLQESILELCCNDLPECFKFADLGCSSGPNAYLASLEVVQALHLACLHLNRRPPMLQIFLNDLPGNDFNTTFKFLPSFYERLKKEKGEEFEENCFIAAVPGSFYGRLFPPHSLHLIFSSYSLHWLSQVPEGLVSESRIPLNKQNVYIARTSSVGVHKAYLKQFEYDFSTFLQARSEELKPGGRMVLTLMGDDKYHPNILEILGMVINDMVLEGLIEESKLESCNFPVYSPCAEEARQVIEREGSFDIHHFDTFHPSWITVKNNKDLESELDNYARGKNVADQVRAVVESFLACHFENALMDDMFQRFSIKVIDYIEMGLAAYTSLLISLIKK